MSGGTVNNHRCVGRWVETKSNHNVHGWGTVHNQRMDEWGGGTVDNHKLVG